MAAPRQDKPGPWQKLGAEDGMARSKSKQKIRKRLNKQRTRRRKRQRLAAKKASD